MIAARGFLICGCLVSLMGGFAGPHRLATAASANSLRDNQEPQGVHAPAGQATIIDKTPAELVQALPQLAGLEPAASQEVLPEILEKIGANVEAYFRSVLSTCAQEETIQQRLGTDAGVEKSVKQTFRYLVVANPEKGPLHLEEYRTDEKGLTAGGSLLTSTVLTERFVYLPVYLHPRYQDDSDFSYVGRQTVTGHKCYVVAFAQIPEAAHLWAQLNEGPVSHSVLLQGLVWADAASFQIIRMFTQLLPVATECKVREFNTDVTFDEVRFPGIDVVVWLPRQVVVDIDWGTKNRRYRNYHHYSNYRLYAAQSRIIY